MRKPSSTSRLPESGQGKRGEAGYLGYLLRQAAGAYRLRMERALADIGVTPPQFSVLTMLAAYPGHSNADLARVALLTPQTISVIVAKLERMRAVERRPHAIHGRVQHLELSKSGRALLAECRIRAHGIERDLQADLSSSKKRAIGRWLVRVATSDNTKQTRSAQHPT